MNVHSVVSSSSSFVNNGMILSPNISETTPTHTEGPSGGIIVNTGMQKKYVKKNTNSTLNESLPIVARKNQLLTLQTGHKISCFTSIIYSVSFDFSSEFLFCCRIGQIMLSKNYPLYRPAPKSVNI